MVHRSKFYFLKANIPAEKDRQNRTSDLVKPRGKLKNKKTTNRCPYFSEISSKLYFEHKASKQNHVGEHINDICFAKN